ncbi:sensor histidine kinase [Jiangella sp. DSM 45060]|uniref:sensor histidine kinase n=1 Tax=Jiangella sp. DSM 45060 TaxID=1798224 RepID=UPI00087D46AB|nr:sensor histidine kinase [Jiangella sp. DSM 45060]SDS25528.1 Signal transduction histidine kinase [Jiangella sp. DSM 45060]
MERVRTWLIDAGITLALVVLGVGGTHGASQGQAWARDPGVFAYTLVVVAALSLLLRRAYPRTTLLINAAALVTYLAADYAYGPIMITVPVVMYTLGHQLPLRSAVRWGGGYYAVFFAVSTVRLLDDSGNDVWRQGAAWAIASLALFGAPLAIGAALKTRRESQADVRAALARRAVSEERLRMAQELHDSVGHGLAVIAMQAGVALHVLDRNPEKVRAALEAIRDTSRSSLDGLRAELQVLRSPVTDAAPRSPGAGLAGVGVLLDRIRAGGVEVVADLDGASGGDLPPDVDVAAYRIVQESLTNVLRHAAATRAEVRIRRAGGELLVDVSDNGVGGGAPPPPPGPAGPAGSPSELGEDDGSGTGIAGMRARAEAVGGRLQAGPRTGGGFAVHARLPLAGADREPDMSGSTS